MSLDEEIETELKHLKKHKELPVSAQSAFTCIPSRRAKSKEYKAGGHDSVFDSIYKRPTGYDQKIHRDDREHAKHQGLDIHGQEIARPVAVLSSSIYGRYLERRVDPINRNFVRMGIIALDFYRKNGISKSLEDGYGAVVPS
uniref:Uncharacterized protein C5orf49 homolog n=1 Tax=Geotrypetes seraphini TaxID=260995 RepID=A0A6P8PNQ9_GEOSA|nr:uncharacterized protein C5orf49 homolog [Geotrypetes seraphini]XP_033785620.1 uncharacterized protein C5orf49 homolog [Geotrypetes seraphini]XP_033785621.1 uncharacterized protein C5orf49 homolog [Geotrypetes seraphini]